MAQVSRRYLAVYIENRDPNLRCPEGPNKYLVRARLSRSLQYLGLKSSSSLRTTLTPLTIQAQSSLKTIRSQTSVHLMLPGELANISHKTLLMTTSANSLRLAPEVAGGMYFRARLAADPPFSPGGSGDWNGGSTTVR
ncbi:hypothetical protein B0H13DRAFT_1850893 [Mycena leptocephala]|nr:hypothetical protein B0H13DRAFT_1850893 [Mycena leptocephala]